MRAPAVLASALLGCLAAACGPSAAFRMTLDGRILEFDCENQAVHPDSAPRLRELPAGGGPGDRMMGLERGPFVVGWLTHFADDGDAFRSDEAHYTIALVLKDLTLGTRDLQFDSASIRFFCSNWGRGFRVCTAASTSGWLRLDEADPRRLRGEFEAVLDGHQERTDRSREPATIRLRGRFDARR